MAAEYRDKWTLITTVRGQCLSFATFPTPLLSHYPLPLKGHGNEADFLGFLQKLVPHRSLTLPFEPFRFWHRIRGDICIQKTTRRVRESAFECLKENWGSRRLAESGSLRLAEFSFKHSKADSSTQRVRESSTPRVGESPWWVGESPWWVGESLFEYFKI